MRLALADLQRDFDFIILDSPPVLPVTDAVVLARFADAVVLVVKGHGAPRALVRRACGQLTHSGARVIGVVVNNVDLEWAGLDSYRGYYGDERRPVAVPAQGRAA
jgi:Mrp family chromosome partitioning ATPase